MKKFKYEVCDFSSHYNQRTEQFTNKAEALKAARDYFRENKNKIDVIFLVSDLETEEIIQEFGNCQH